MSGPIVIKRHGARRLKGVKGMCTMAYLIRMHEARGWEYLSEIDRLDREAREAEALGRAAARAEIAAYVRRRADERVQQIERAWDAGGEWQAVLVKAGECAAVADLIERGAGARAVTPADAETCPHRRAIMLALGLVRAAYQRAREGERRGLYDPSAASSALDALEQEIEALLTEPTP